MELMFTIGIKVAEVKVAFGIYHRPRDYTADDIYLLNQMMILAEFPYTQ